MKASHVIFGLSLSLPPYVASITGCHDKTGHQGMQRTTVWKEPRSLDDNIDTSIFEFRFLDDSMDTSTFEFNLTSGTSARNKYDVVKSL